MRSFFICFVAALLACTCVYGQSVSKIEIVGAPFSNTDCFFIGEIHTVKERTSFNVGMVNYVHEHYGIHNVVLELGQSLAYLCNQYLENGDTIIFLFTDEAPRQYLSDWKVINASLPRDKQIRVYGMDFERMIFVKALQVIFNKNEGARSFALYTYISSLPDSVCQFNELFNHKKSRKEMYNHAKHLFRQEKESLRSLVTTDFDVMEGMMENPAMERHFARRDAAMAKNLEHQLKGKPFLFIVGQAHTDVSVKRSMLHKFMRANPERTITLITEARKNTDDAYTVGPKYIMHNDSMVKAVYGKYYKADRFIVAGQNELNNKLPTNDGKISFYYIFFKEHPIVE